MSLQWALGAGVPELPCLWRPWVSLCSGAICYIVILWGWWNHSVWAVISHWDIGVGILSTSPLHLLPLGRFGRAPGGGTALPRRILQKWEEKVWYFVHKYLVPLRVAAAMAFTTKNGYAQAYQSIHQSYDLHHHVRAFKPTCQEEKAHINYDWLSPGTAISHHKCRTVPGTTTTVVPVSKVSFCTNLQVSGQMQWFFQ